jgi:TetR/AcrR family transcriptional repressor of lmrAB and yxaGH operons
MAPGDAAITEAARAAFDAVKDILGERLREDGVPAARAASLATLALAAIEGSLIQARVAASVEPLEAMAREIETLFAANVVDRARKARRRG